jgi:hypothetical protein
MDYALVLPPRCQHQGRHAVLIRRVNGGSSLKQFSNKADIPVAHGGVEKRQAK